MRAEPKNTTVSRMCSRRKCARGSRYSDRIRIARPSALSRKSSFLYATRTWELGWDRSRIDFLSGFDRFLELLDSLGELPHRLHQVPHLGEPPPRPPPPPPAQARGA